MGKLEIRDQFFDEKHQANLVKVLRDMPYRPCPDLLGKFGYSRYPIYSRSLDPLLTLTIKRLLSLVPGQAFNTLFVQHYPEGSFVRKHRDPKNNTGMTIIAVFGDSTFEPGLSRHGDQLYIAKSGDVVIQPCTIDGVQGEPHEVYKIKGNRFAVILNTIEKQPAVTSTTVVQPRVYKQP